MVAGIRNDHLNTNLRMYKMLNDMQKVSADIKKQRTSLSGNKYMMMAIAEE